MNTLFSRIHFSLIHMIRLMKPLCFIFDLLDYDQHKECVVYNNQVIPLRWQCPDINSKGFLAYVVNWSVSLQLGRNWFL
jgi:hypothetical protein